MHKCNIFYYFLLFSSLLIGFSTSNLRNDKNKTIEYRIDKSKSLSQNGERIYEKYLFINFNKLYEMYNNLNRQDLAKFNHVHITLCVNEEYHLLASVTIASILNNSNSNTYNHFHIIALNNLSIKTMEKIFSLRAKINKNSEFIFYNGKRAEEDFQVAAKTSPRGMIDFGRLLISELIDDDNIERIISLDIGNIIAEKDLYELYNENLTFYAYLGVQDSYPKCFMKSIYNHKENYVNCGVLLLNIKKIKEINIYKYLVKMYNYVLDKAKFYNPYSDIMNDFFPWASNDFLPLKYNMPDFIKINDTEQSDYKIWSQKCSHYFNKKEEVIEAEKNIVIRNYENYPIYKGRGNNYMKQKWMKYAELTGFKDDIIKKYLSRYTF